MYILDYQCLISDKITSVDMDGCYGHIRGHGLLLRTPVDMDGRYGHMDIRYYSFFVTIL